MANPPPFSQFSDLYDPLTKLLNTIKAAAPTGTPLPATSKLGNTLASPGTTDKGANAYGTAHQTASTTITKTVTALTDQQVGYCSGLGFSKPGDISSNRTDLVNSVLSAYDGPAAKYMKNQISDGDNLVPALQQRLSNFDAAVGSAGSTAATPDQPPSS